MAIDRKSTAEPGGISAGRPGVTKSLFSSVAFLLLYLVAAGLLVIEVVFLFFSLSVTSAGSELGGTALLIFGAIAIAVQWVVVSLVASVVMVARRKQRSVTLGVWGAGIAAAFVVLVLALVLNLGNMLRESLASNIRDLVLIVPCFSIFGFACGSGVTTFLIAVYDVFASK